MTETFDQKIEEFNAKPKLVKYRTIVDAELTYEEEKKLKPIYDYFSNDLKRTVLEVSNISGKYQIAKVRHRRNKGEPNEILYHIFVNYKRINECAYSLDSALLIAITHQYNAERAVGWIENMIGMKYEPEFEEE